MHVDPPFVYCRSFSAVIDPTCLFPLFLFLFLLQLGCVTLFFIAAVTGPICLFPLSFGRKSGQSAGLLFIVKRSSTAQSTELLKAIVLHRRSPGRLIWLNTLSQLFGFLQVDHLLLLQLLLQLQLSPVPQLLVLVHKVVGGELGPADLAGEKYCMLRSLITSTILSCSMPWVHRHWVDMAPLALLVAVV